MNFFSYVESLFVGTQLNLQSKSGGNATAGLALVKASRAWLWITLQCATLFHFFTIPFKYLGVIVRLLDQPPSAHKLIADAERKKNTDEESAKKLSAEILAQIGKDRADQGLDELKKVGNS